MAVLVVKRVADHVEAALSIGLLLVGLCTAAVLLSSPSLLCLPASCGSRPQAPPCARDWSYLSSVLSPSRLPLPYSNFHFLLLSGASLSLLLLAAPLFYGSLVCTETFASFSSVWQKVRVCDPCTRDQEWRRKMHLVLDQLRTSTQLSERYALFHGLGLFLDLLLLLATSLYTLHFLDFSLPTAYFSRAALEDSSSVCHLPSQGLLQFFGLCSSLLLLAKSLNRLLCLLFACGLPGLFGRSMLLYADQVIDKNDEKVYSIACSPATVLAHTLAMAARILIFSPALALAHAIKFYSQSLVDLKGAEAELSAELVPAEEVPQQPHNGTNGHATLVEERKLRVCPEVPHNWSDFFFVLDLLGGSAVDRAELLIFLGRTEDLVPRLEEKRVETTLSRLDTSTNTLSLAYSEGGIVEKLIDTELYSSGGLAVAGWLEGPTGRVEQLPHQPGMFPAYKVVPGTSYEVVSALVGREGRLLARLPNYAFHAPTELKARQKKKYGLSVPLSALSATEGRPLSLNFDFN